MTTARVVVLASGAGSNLAALLTACGDGTLPAQVVGVVSNQAGAYALQRARDAGLATAVVSLRVWRAAGGDRDGYDGAVAEAVAALQPDVVVLAGWMLVLGPTFLDRFPGRVLNLHPALPGAFPGTHAIERAWHAHRDGHIHQTGVMVHRVVPEIDAGPVVRWEAVPLRDGEPLDELTLRMHAVEHRVLVQAVGEVLAELTAPPSA